MHETAVGTLQTDSRSCLGAGPKERPMRSVILWLIGIPIPIILLIALCTHHF
jgi:hypothetical protein